ncbi:cyclin-like protein [Russula earlei]|uniref:Cyclin-like protein n=1 Tax=Russula earlei TaxID=71964 RepID=A0ACC0U5E0_9AGAM|nr:cyclin-like protein [Russula earlei]
MPSPPQRVIATATVFSRRFYVKNLYCETDPFMVIAACCYVAAKAEESPVHIKNVVSESRLMFSQEGYGIKTFPSDNSKLAEMEFYLVSDLECDLIVSHLYRTLLTLCRREAAHAVVSEAGEVGLCLLYPPHMTAIAAIYLTLVLNDKTRDAIPAQSAAPAPPPRRSSRTNTGSADRKPAPVQQQDFVDFMAGLRCCCLRMREARLADLAHPASGQPMATNKRLGRTQAAG